MIEDIADIIAKTPDDIYKRALKRAETAKQAELVERAAKAPNLTCLVDQFPLAMAAIARVHDYARGPLVKGDYRPSLLRHLFGIGEHEDHDAAAAWNAIAHLELRERAKQGAKE